MSVSGYFFLSSSANNTIASEGYQTTLLLGGARIPLASSYTIVLGEINVVNIIEDWDVLEE